MTVQNISPAQISSPPPKQAQPQPQAQALASSPIHPAQQMELVRRMLDLDIHPVLIIGTTHSGKTCMLCSLLSYARSHPEAGLAVSLGANVFPDGYPNSDSRYANAVQFYNQTVPAFISGRAPEDSSLNEHFFIPINVSVNRPGMPVQTIKLAFLEGMGEWYGLATDGNNFKALSPDVAALVDRFGNAMSFIYMAPSQPTAEGGAAFLRSHQSLSHRIDEYSRRLRESDGSRDNLMLLATHWDRLFPPGSDFEKFAAPGPDEIQSVVGAWPFSWASFSNIAVPGKKAMMPYSAGLISETGRTVTPPQRQAEEGLRRL